ncbi:hypothetical protein [Alteribacillus bidgolensis]|uniref:Uncharacterized protein n=1 Tax=Alteribacillus bidgolensis TaxID=930129 RepID=A0A1G8CFT4_9BACI|nr:hypothetical protein [Alteribacillus bidgolensis]SDH44364.1 hypothetical protein SAMN05216352_101308 [Alteribacillus bidgolensis]
MKAYRRKFYYLGQNQRTMEPMSMDRIRQAGFDITVKRDDLPYMISFCREWRSFFEKTAKHVHPLYRPYIEESSSFFDEQVEQMTLCTAPHHDTNTYILPFTDLVSALMLAYDAFDRVLDAYQSMPAHFETALKYYRQFSLKSDADKAQFILNHLPDLRLSVE